MLQTVDFLYRKPNPSEAQINEAMDDVIKNPEDYRIIGTPKERLDIPNKVMGKTVYGIDFTTPDMCIAIVACPTRYGASLQSYDAEAAMAKSVSFTLPDEICQGHNHLRYLNTKEISSAWATAEPGS